MAFRWQAYDDTLMVEFGPLSSTQIKKSVVGVVPPLTKLSGSAHVKLFLN